MKTFQQEVLRWWRSFANLPEKDEIEVLRNELQNATKPFWHVDLDLPVLAEQHWMEPPAMVLPALADPAVQQPVSPLGPESVVSSHRVSTIVGDSSIYWPATPSPSWVPPTASPLTVEPTIASPSRATLRSSEVVSTLAPPSAPTLAQPVAADQQQEPLGLLRNGQVAEQALTNVVKDLIDVWSSEAAKHGVHSFNHISMVQRRAQGIFLHEPTYEDTEGNLIGMLFRALLIEIEKAGLRDRMDPVPRAAREWKKLHADQAKKFIAGCRPVWSEMNKAQQLQRLNWWLFEKFSLDPVKQVMIPDERFGAKRKRAEISWNTIWMTEDERNKLAQDTVDRYYLYFECVARSSQSGHLIAHQ